MSYCIIVNENMHDADAWIEQHEGAGLPTMASGWERVYSLHDTREAAEAALPAAKEYAKGRLLR